MGASAHSPVGLRLHEPARNNACALRGIAVVVLVGLVLFLLVPLPALGVPAVGALLAALVEVAVANAQKRL